MIHFETQHVLVEAKPFKGSIIHAVRVQEVELHRPTDYLVTTYNRAVCGVGRSGLQILLTPDRSDAVPWVGFERRHCPKCSKRAFGLTDFTERSNNCFKCGRHKSHIQRHKDTKTCDRHQFVRRTMVNLKEALSGTTNPA